MIGIYTPPQDRVDRRLLNPPAEWGKAPTFKEDGTPVEIHHEGQSMDGPYREMHWRDHRGKGNDKKNHPNKGKEPSRINRRIWDKQQENWWKRQYPPDLPIT